MSGSHDILRNTWIYVDIKREVQKEVQEQQRAEQRRIFLEIVQARFPRMEALARQVIEEIAEPEVLAELIIRVGSARIEREARQSIVGAR